VRSLADNPATGNEGPPRIAVDGPAAAGKSTVGRRLAEALDSLYFDTGALYRTLTVVAERASVDSLDGPALAGLAAVWSVDVRASSADPGYQVLVDGDDVTQLLRDESIDAAVSAVASHAEVREILLGVQRRIGAGRVVMVGRDIGTVVLPDAELKIYLDASPGERARRRFREMLTRGEPARFSDVLGSMLARDKQDADRSIAPLARAKDAVIVDTDRCTEDEVVAHLRAIARRWPDDLTENGGEAPCGRE
jgi:CMP/dCMP kinase